MKTTTQQIENPPREKRQFWAVTEFGDVKRVTGFDCRPNNPDTWWVPELGFSMTKGFHLFDDEEDALEKAITEQAEKAATAQKNLGRLNDRLKKARLA